MWSIRKQCLNMPQWLAAMKPDGAFLMLAREQRRMLKGIQLPNGGRCGLSWTVVPMGAVTNCRIMLHIQYWGDTPASVLCLGDLTRNRLGRDENFKLRAV